MKSKFGPHGGDVEAFLAEAGATTDPLLWDQVLAGRDQLAGVAAVRALSDAKLPASVDSAVDRGARLVYRGLHLTREDLPHAVLGPRDVSSAIRGAAAALAVSDRLAVEHRRWLLGPFVAVGFTSVLTSHAWAELAADASPEPEAASPPDAG